MGHGQSDTWTPLDDQGISRPPGSLLCPVCAHPSIPPPPTHPRALGDHRRLIDVLKRQRAHLEAARGLALTEEMFMAALEGSSA